MYCRVQMRMWAGAYLFETDVRRAAFPVSEYFDFENDPEFIRSQRANPRQSDGGGTRTIRNVNAIDGFRGFSLCQRYHGEVVSDLDRYDIVRVGNPPDFVQSQKM